MVVHTFAAIYIGTYDVSLKVFEFMDKKKFHQVDHIRARLDLGSDALQRAESDMNVWKSCVRHWHSSKKSWTVIA